jgi:hypothetical protein
MTDKVDYLCDSIIVMYLKNCTLYYVVAIIHWYSLVIFSNHKKQNKKYISVYVARYNVDIKLLMDINSIYLYFINFFIGHLV